MQTLACIKKKFLIRLHCVCLGKASKHRGKALLLKGDLPGHLTDSLRSGHFQGRDDVGPNLVKQRKELNFSFCQYAWVPQSRDFQVPGDSTATTDLLRKSNSMFLGNLLLAVISAKVWWARIVCSKLITTYLSVEQISLSYKCSNTSIIPYIYKSFFFLFVLSHWIRCSLSQSFPYEVCDCVRWAPPCDSVTVFSPVPGSQGCQQSPLIYVLFWVPGLCISAAGW